VSIFIKVADLNTEFSDIQQIRYFVFQVEQAIDYVDEFDGKDPESLHLIAYFMDQPVGTLRIRDIGEAIAKVERLAVLKDFRSLGIGKQLMLKAIATITELGTYRLVKIHAQSYLEGFYTKLGFTAQGDKFMEAGIEHIVMINLI
jgi:predicted GNAT family N-acyltransferase